METPLLRLLAIIVFVSALGASGREPIIIDTDSALFGDDGAALVMLLRNPQQVSVQAVIATPGNVWAPQSAEYIFNILELLRRPSPPVLSGVFGPLMHTSAMAREAGRRWGPLTYIGAFGQDPDVVKAVPNRKRNARIASAGAVQFIINETQHHPNELTIVELAPMTTLAMALRMKPDIEGKIRRLVFVGGNIRVDGNATSGAEFNFWFDPEAARMVLRSTIPEKIMFPLDVCNTVTFRKREFDRIAAAGTPIAALFREDLGKRSPGFLKKANVVGHMCDALAAAYLLDPGIVLRSEMSYLDVQTTWGRFYGAAYPLDRSLAPGATPIRVVQQIDYGRVFSLYERLLTRRD